MNDTAYQRAERRYAELKQELAEVEQFLRLYKKFAGSGRDDGFLTQENVSKTVGTPDFDGGTISKRVNPPRSEVARIARKIMLDSGVPQTRSELVDAFKRYGSPIQGADPGKNIGTLMWRMSDKFVNIEGHGYWPKDIPCPKYGYVINKEADKPRFSFPKPNLPKVD